MKLQEILDKVKKAIQISNPDHNVVIKRLHLSYDMRLVTFGINKKKPDSSIFSFCTAIHTLAAVVVSN